MLKIHSILILLGGMLLLGACNQNYQLAFEQAQDIKTHGLVFRLSDYQQRIEYFEKQGLTERAGAEKLKIAQENRDLVENFQQEFDFCPVYFYYASQQSELQAGKRVLLNAKLEPETSIPLPAKVIVAYFAPGEINENSFKGNAFRFAGTTAFVPPTYLTRYGERDIKAADVRKLNRLLYKKSRTPRPK